MGHRRAAAAAATLALVVLAGVTACGGDNEEPTTADPTVTAPSIEERCDSGIPTDAAVTTTVLGDGDLSLLAATFAPPDGVEPGDTVLVLLHQTGPFGLCGWGRWASEAAAAGIRSVAIDMCGIGGSECAEGEATPPADQVDLAASYARDELGAGSVVLVGSSMGGSQTVIAVAGGAEVDAWVDLSGPSKWDGTVLADLSADVQAAALPGLVVHAPDDGPDEFAAARDLAEATGAEFREGESGHGYELLATNQGDLRPDGEYLLDWVTQP